jgi:hypothetical protein
LWACAAELAEDLIHLTSKLAGVLPPCLTPLSILTLHSWQVFGFALRENALVRGANGHVQRKPTPRILNGVPPRPPKKIHEIPAPAS